MNAQFDEGDWMMGGSSDAKANSVLGVSEAEVAQMSVEAYGYAWDKCRGDQLSLGGKARFVAEFVSELDCCLRDRLQLPQSE